METMDSIVIQEEDPFFCEYDTGHDLVIDLKENISDGRVRDRLDSSASKAKNIQCEYCPKTFLQASNYKTHLKVHGRGDQLYICALCGRDFQYKNSFQIHVATHNQGKIPATPLKNKTLLSFTLAPYCEKSNCH